MGDGGYMRNLGSNLQLVMESTLLSIQIMLVVIIAYSLFIISLATGVLVIKLTVIAVNMYVVVRLANKIYKWLNIEQ